MGALGASPESLPDDLILEIVGHLDTARDVASITSSSRRTYNLLHQDGWKSFVKTQFPSLLVPASPSTSWAAVADRLTYLDRCWEKRAFQLNVFKEKPRIGGHRIPRQSVLFNAIVDVACHSSSGEEMLVWGAGEDLVLRRSGAGSTAPQHWTQLRGYEHGYSAGTGDVTALSVLEREATWEVVVGRASGELELLSAADDSLGQVVHRFLPALEAGSAPIAAALKASPAQTAISWAQWEPRSGLLASCKGSVLTLYNLAAAAAEEEEGEVRPAASCDVSRLSPADEACLTRSVKFFNHDSIACALGGSRESLRWGKITPHGIALFHASRNERVIEERMARLELLPFEKTTVRAIEPVNGRDSSLLLSAWDDGTYRCVCCFSLLRGRNVLTRKTRLTDVRTPSDHDTIYRDQFQPYSAGSSLLVYGTERFVAGSKSQPDIRIFDFRYPKIYHHSKAYACSSEAPIPRRPYEGSIHNNIKGPFACDAEDASSSWQSRCDARRGVKCHWHQESMADSWRPDATVYLGSSSYDYVSSLSKASDISGKFYCGIRGGIVEATMSLPENGPLPGRQPTAPQGWQVRCQGGDARLMETGVSLCTSEQWKGGGSGRLPRVLYHQNPWYLPEEPRPCGSPRSRLDCLWRTQSGEMPT